MAAANLTFSQALDFDGGDVAVVNVMDANDMIVAEDIIPITDTDGFNALWEDSGPVALPVGEPVRIEWCFEGNGGTTSDFLGWDIDNVKVVLAAP